MIDGTWLESLEDDLADFARLEHIRSEMDRIVDQLRTDNYVQIGIRLYEAETLALARIEAHGLTKHRGQTR